MTRYDKLINRRTDPDVTKYAAFSANEAYREAKEGENTRYALGAMQPIDPDYTANTVKQCDRVQNQLHQAFQHASLGVEFDHQGSTTNNTHVRARSDIDLLTVVNRFHKIQPPNRPVIPYAGDTVADLRQVRRVTIAALSSAFPTATVDQSGSKSIKVDGGSLTRQIDVISCAWWHTVEYVTTHQKQWLGIAVLDDEKGEEVFNKPFLHNKRIDERDAATAGRTRKAIRLLKSLMYDSDSAVELSSYDIVGVVYNMYDTVINASGKEHDLFLLEKCDTWLNVLEYCADVRAAIDVPNQTRKVFCAGGATLNGVRQLRKELTELIAAVQRELAAAKRRLDEVVIPTARPERLIPRYQMPLIRS